MAAIFMVSGIPDLGPLPANTSDKVAHFAAYALLGLLLARAFAGAAWIRYSRDTVLAAWFVAALYAVTDEFHQSFVPGRTPSLGDWLADSAGALLGAMVAFAVARALRRTRE